MCCVARVVQVVQLPICVSPMNFFVNVPKDARKSVLGSATSNIKLSACTLAKIFSVRFQRASLGMVTQGARRACGFEAAVRTSEVRASSSHLCVS